MTGRRKNSHTELSTLIAVAAAIGLSLVVGCRSRGEYRRWADEEVAGAISDKQCDERWVLPERPVAPDAQSRMADHSCPDCGPLPPDDPAAQCFMEFPDRFRGWPFWHERGDLPQIEFSEWQQHLPIDEDGVLRLNRDTAIELAGLHSREYQDQVEQLYFAALALTFERFEFDTQWFYRSGNSFDYRGVGGLPTESRLLTSSRNAGFNKNLTSGGQLLVDFANSFVWEFAGDTISSASSGLLVSLSQPLLRGAFREVRLEGLTQAERNLLYGVRTFARFRRSFYVGLVGDGYLPLLAAAQGIKNLEKNLESLELNLEEHEQLSRAGLVAPIQVDQVFQQYQQGRLSLLAARQSLQAALDRFKLVMGLPPRLELELAEETLSPFELTSPEIETLQASNERLRLEMVQSDETPTMEEIKQRYVRLKESQDKLVELKKEVNEEFDRWNDRLRTSGDEMGLNDDDRERLDRELELAERLGKALEELEEMIDDDRQRIESGTRGKWIPPKKVDDDDPLIDAYDLESDEPPSGDKEPSDNSDSHADVQRSDPEDDSVDRLRDASDGSDAQPEGKAGFILRELFRYGKRTDRANEDDRQGKERGDSDEVDDSQENKEDRDDKKTKRDPASQLWDELQNLVGKRIRKQLADLFVIQTQVRVYLIESTPTQVDEDSAIQAAFCNRLDLMNARGSVVDAYRKVEVAADALEAELNLQLQANLGTDPGSANPVRFDASANRYRVGIEFDSPITRLAERNAYRAAQIRYQQARRAYMAVKDQIAAEVRNDIRRVEFNKFSFEIAKLQLLTAARQVDEAQVNLRNSTEPNSSFTRNLLEALQGLLGAKNNLIQSWVSYEASRMALYRDLEQMQIASDGTWINESTDQSNFIENDPADVFYDAQTGRHETDEFNENEFERRYFDSQTAEPADDTAGNGDIDAGDSRLPGVIEPAPFLRLPQPN